jgi:hypothetical protein
LEITSTTTQNLPTQVSGKADEGFAVSAQPNGRLRVLVATNLFGNIAIPEFFP